MQKTYISNYWGKARPSDDKAPTWHPLAYHSLDVAAAMKTMIEARTQWVLALSARTSLTATEVKKWLILAAALHDLGKFAENFQGKVPELLEAFGHAPKASTIGHGQVGNCIWKTFGERKCLSEQTQQTLKTWVEAACSHHGTPVPHEGNIGDYMTRQSFEAALDYTKACFELFGSPSEANIDRQVLKTWQETGPWQVAGLCILADWIGSNQAYFPYEAPIWSLKDYWALAQERAAKALSEIALEDAPCAASLALSDLIEGASAASPLQAFAEAETPTNAPQLYLIEDLTGAGKTEAALILSHRLMKAGAAEGLYWALPSMATANGLYNRLATTYRRLFSSPPLPSLVLAHSARELHDGFQVSLRTSGENYDRSKAPDSISAEASCAQFFADDRKKTLLAQVGIGTLDQALLGALPVRHQSLRLAALSRRVLVVDEAHAFDDYMTKGLEALLKLHRNAGGSAIILSATLTQDQRKRFVRAYAQPASEGLKETAFPLVTHVHEKAETAREVPQTATRGTHRDLSFERFETPELAMDYLLSKAKDGQCGIYIRNTVTEAREAFDYLKKHHDQVDIFHARYAIGDRLARETEILNRFGKSSTPEQRRGQILVATQVAEQSLDLDFDHMVTDLCPMDLLIQRAGRLHRHGHRPPRPEPKLGIVSAPLSEGQSEDWYAKLFPSGQYVYPHVGELWRTLHTLEALGGLPLKTGSPRDLIEPVFSPLEDLTPEALQNKSEKAMGERQAARALGGLNFLKPEDFTPSKESWASDVCTPTRLGEQQVLLRLAVWQNDKILPLIDAGETSWRLSEISVPARIIGTPVAPCPEAEKEIKALEAKWSKAGPGPLILALTRSDNGTDLHGQWTSKSGVYHEIRYSTSTGLAY